MASKELVLERLPVDEPFVLTGAFMQTTGYWSPEHPHMGEDWGHPNGGGAMFRRPCYAGGHGVVHAVDRMGNATNEDFGLFVIIDYVDTPWYGGFAHLDEALVEPGQRVFPGTKIGLIGYSGKVEPKSPAGAHLHTQLSTSASFPRDASKVASWYSFLRQGGGENDVDAELRALVEAQGRQIEDLMRRTGGAEGSDYDLLAGLRNQQTAFVRHLREEHPAASQTLELDDEEVA